MSVGDNVGIVEEREREGSSVRVSSLSMADLQAATRLLCFRHATFFMILSKEGPRILPQRVEPPRDCDDAIDDEEERESEISEI